jgi:hypothetical protein
MNNEFLVANVFSKFDKEMHKYICYYFVWDRSDYSKKPFKTNWFQYRELIFGPLISSNLIDIPVISEGGNLLIDETKRFTSEPEATIKELNLKTKSQTIKEMTIPDFTPPVINYRYQTAMISHQLKDYKEFSATSKDYNNLPVQTLIFRNNQRILWQTSFQLTTYIIGWSENYLAASNSFPGKVTVYKVIDGKPILNFKLGSPKKPEDFDDDQYWIFLKKYRSEKEVQFSRNRIACKDHVVRFSRNEHPPFDLYIMDLATGKIILECNQDLGFPDVKRFLFHEDALVLEQSNKILLAKFWI